MRWSPALLHERDGDRVRCTLCPIGCRLDEGQTGTCRVRRRVGDTMETATFATSVAHRGPVERKPLYHYRPGTTALTLAAPGCTFDCDYCVNHRISQFGRQGGAPWKADPVDVAATVSRAGGASAHVALSYSEPSLAIELTLALADHGARVLWKTNGFLTPEAVRTAAPALTAANIDVKAADEERHRALTGRSLKPVLRTLADLRSRGVWVEVSTPLIPGTSADPHDLEGIAATLAAIDPDIPWHLMRFTPAHRRTGDSPTTPAALAVAREIGRTAGLHHVYVDRALGEEGRTTRCPSCAGSLIERDVNRTRAMRLSQGRCPFCATRIQGRW